MSHYETRFFLDNFGSNKTKNQIYYSISIYKNIRSPITLASVNTTQYEEALKIAQFHCNCKYLWLRELHGLSAFMMSNSLMSKVFWAIVIMACAGWSIGNTISILKQYGDEATTTLLTILPVHIELTVLVSIRVFHDFRQNS